MFLVPAQRRYRGDGVVGVKYVGKGGVEGSGSVKKDGEVVTAGNLWPWCVRVLRARFRVDCESFCCCFIGV